MAHRDWDGEEQAEQVDAQPYREDERVLQKGQELEQHAHCDARIMRMLLFMPVHAAEPH